jgi:glycosyltransferase involved in cell wall biosynthesis
MLRAARSGHSVLFVETGHFLGKHLASLVRGPHRASLAERLFATEEGASGVRLRKAVNLVPWGSRFRAANAVNAALTARLLRRLATRMPGPVVLWIYDPGAARMAGSFGEAFVVYDCVDDYPAQTTSANRRDQIEVYERMLTRSANLVFATSRTMFERLRPLNAGTHLVSNAGDYDHFARAVDRSITAPAVEGLTRPVIGFTGNFLSAKVDFALLEAIARERAHWTLLLIGPATVQTRPVLDRLGRLPNVHWLGPRPYADLPRYVAAFDVGLIPYVSNAYTRSCFPLKLYEYLAAGKPVVASGVPELAGMEPDVALVEGTTAFVEAVEEVLVQDAEADRIRRRTLAAHNSWEAKTERLLELVHRELHKRPA